MAKKIIGFIKLQIPAGKANPSPPVGPALGQRGLNIMEFRRVLFRSTLTQRGTNRGRRVRLGGRDLQLDEADNLLGHDFS